MEGESSLKPFLHHFLFENYKIEISIPLSYQLIISVGT